MEAGNHSRFHIPTSNEQVPYSRLPIPSTIAAVPTAPEHIVANLNEPQKQSVLHINGPALILAGAGSGKTRALTHRIAYLIDQGVQPWQILAVTFTNKAATEMKERIKNMLHITEGTDIQTDPYKLQTTSYKLPTMGTFHSICARILRRDIEHLGRNRSFVIYDGDDQEKLMKQVLKEMKIDEKEFKAAFDIYIQTANFDDILDSYQEKVHGVIERRLQDALILKKGENID